jgi:hypothetical protein
MSADATAHPSLTMAAVFEVAFGSPVGLDTHVASN